VASFTPHPLYSRERGPGTHWVGDWVGHRTGLNAVEKIKFSCLCRESNPGRETRSSSVYRLSYPGSHLVSCRYLYTGQHKCKINPDIHPCINWDSNPRSQYLSGCRARQQGIDLAGKATNIAWRGSRAQSIHGFIPRRQCDWPKYT
jgi:hypothetical protein